MPQTEGEQGKLLSNSALFLYLEPETLNQKPTGCCKLVEVTQVHVWGNFTLFLLTRVHSFRDSDYQQINADVNLQTRLKTRGDRAFLGSDLLLTLETFKSS